MQTVEAYLGARGISTAAWSIWSVNCISADGNVLAGQGMLNGQLQAWVAVVPGPGAAVPLMLAGLTASRRRRRLA